MAESNDLGRWGEDIAALYLVNHGYDIVERDWRDGHRDIDIIAVDGDTMVFVEVKTRSDNTFGEPEQAVGYEKARMLKRAATRYARSHHIRLFLRFDIIAVTGTPDSDVSIKHYEGVFQSSRY